MTATTGSVDPPLAPGASPEDDSFSSYLIALLGVYELGPPSGMNVSVPIYNGPSSRQTEHILRSLGSIAKRMWAAEERAYAQGVESLDTPKRPGDRTDRSALSVSGGAQAETEGISEDSEPHLTCPTPMMATARVDSPVVPPSNLPSNLPLEAGRETQGYTDALISREHNPQNAPDVLSESSPPSATEELRLLKSQLGDVARVCSAVARGDLGHKITTPVQGAVMVQLKDVINGMVDTIRHFATELKELSHDWKYGNLCCHGSAVRLEGEWKELMCCVAQLFGSWTNQIRSLASVTKAVSLGHLGKLVEVEARGEALELKCTVNGMVMRLRAIAEEVSRVALEVDSKGKLDGQADVQDAEGAWLDLVGNVNRICSHLDGSL